MKATDSAMRMNLAEEPWIPVSGMDGRSFQTSLLDCFVQGSEIADLAVRPHERVALMRLLICISHAALDGPKTHADWKNIPGDLPSKASAYLQVWKDSFWLYHPEKPFLQVLGLRSAAKAGDEAALSPFSKLDFARASGNNSTLFDHAGQNPETTIMPATLALNLLTYQMFSPGGRIGKVFWGNIQTTNESCDAPCIPVAMLHTFLRGKNLLKTLQLNICDYARIGNKYRQYGAKWLGKPLWEQFPTSPSDAEAVYNATQTYLGRLTPLSRAVLLQDNNLVLGNGLDYPGFSNDKKKFVAEPSATVVLRKSKTKTQEALLAFRQDKAVWRELHAITAQGLDGAQTRGPLALTSIQSALHQPCDILVVALARKQAAITNSCESVYPLNPVLLGEDGRRIYESGVQDAEQAAMRLSWAVGTYCMSLYSLMDKETKSKKINSAMLAFWTEVESDLSLLFKTLDADDNSHKERWINRVWQHAYAVYDRLCGIRDEYGVPSSRHVKAYAKGKARFTLRKLWKEGQVDESALLVPETIETDNE